MQLYFWCTCAEKDAIHIFTPPPSSTPTWAFLWSLFWSLYCVDCLFLLSLILLEFSLVPSLGTHCCVTSFHLILLLFVCFMRLATSLSGRSAFLGNILWGPAVYFPLTRAIWSRGALCVGCMCFSVVVELNTMGGLVGLAYPWLVGIEVLDHCSSCPAAGRYVSLNAFYCMAQGVTILVMPQKSNHWASDWVTQDVLYLVFLSGGWDYGPSVPLG